MTQLATRRGAHFEYTASVDKADGTNYDLTGATLWFTVKEGDDAAADDSAALVRLYWVHNGASDGITVATPNTGNAVVTMPAAITDDFEAGRTYAWDFLAKDAASRVFWTDGGTLRVDPTVRHTLTTP